MISISVFYNNNATHIGIIGDVRSGKTLLMVWLSFIYSKNREVRANLKELSHPNFNHLTLGDFLHLDEFNHVDVLIDEIYAWLESRFGFDEVNLLLSYFGFQAGKRDVNIIWTAQFMMSVDNRYRFLAKVLFSAHHNKKRKRFEYKRYIRTMIGEPPYQIPHYEFIDSFFLTEENASKLYGKYDTFEIIEPRRKKQLEWGLLNADEDAFEVAMNGVRSAIAKEIEEPNRVTRERVRIKMEKLGIPFKFESNIYYPLLDDFSYYYEYDT